MVMPLDQFLAERRSLFRNAPVPEIDLLESAERLREVTARNPSVHRVQARPGRVLIQPRCGINDHEAMKAVHRTLALSDILTITIDSNTRLCLWEKARTNGRLNGYPLVTSGVAQARDLVDAAVRPLEVRHGSPDGRLLAEVAYACGINSYEGGGITYNLPYCKEVPLRQSLSSYRYIDRLTGLLSAAADVPIDRETFGTLTAVLVPPSLAITISILEVALAVEQGVRSVTIGIPETGCLLQDIAALEVIPALCQSHLRRLGLAFTGPIFTSFHQWMGIFPPDPETAWRVIGYGVIAASYGRATKLINKTPQEQSACQPPRSTPRQSASARSWQSSAVRARCLRCPRLNWPRSERR